MADRKPAVEEIGATSAPLKSAAFFIGSYCKAFNGVFSLLCSAVVTEMKC
jgi:NADH dehydrogenase (ubiquinone) 1 alpha subcomplex subunit 8